MKPLEIQILTKTNNTAKEYALKFTPFKQLTPIKINRQKILLLAAILVAAGLAYAYSSEASKNKELNDRLVAAEQVSNASAGKMANLAKENADFVEKFKAAEEVFAEKEKALADANAALQACTPKKHGK